MTITVNGVAVPAQSKNLDTTTVTTGFGLVHRQIIGIADPENPSQYARLTGTSLNVNVTNASLAVTAAALPLPSGAATEATLQGVLDAVGGIIITNSSSTATLASGASFTGTATDVSSFGSITAAVLTDQNGTLYVEFSPDGTNWDSSIPYSVSAGLNEVHRLTVTRQYMRVRFTNTSASAQTYFRLQSLAGDQPILTSRLGSTIQEDADTVITRPLDFNLMVASNLYQNRSVLVKDGLNDAISTGTTPEDITNEGGVYAGFPTATGAAEIVVAGADTGTVYYYYLASDTDTAYTLGSKAITGAATYSLGHNIWRCNFAWFESSSATAFNAGAITIRHTATPTNVFCVINAGFSQTFCSAYTVPYGNSIYLDSVRGNMRGSTSGSLDGVFWYREFGKSPRLRFPFELQFGTLYFDDTDYLISIPERTDIIPRIITASTNGLSAKISYRLLQVRA